MFKNIMRHNPWAKWYPQPSLDTGLMLLIEDNIAGITAGVYKSLHVGVVVHLRDDLAVKMAILEPDDVRDPGLHRKLNELIKDENFAAGMRSNSGEPLCSDALFAWTGLCFERGWIPKIVKKFPRPLNQLQLELSKISPGLEILAQDILFNMRMVERANPLSKWFLRHLNIIFDTNPANVRRVPGSQMLDTIVLEKTYAGNTLIQYALPDFNYIHEPQAGETIFWKPGSGIVRQPQPVRPVNGPWVHLTIEPCKKPIL
jgi:hypothetical protein